MNRYLGLLREKCLGILLSATVFLLACSSRDDSSDDAGSLPNGEWLSLFDGKTFNGWHTYGMDSITKAWKIEDSAIHLSSLQQNGWQTLGGGDLVTNEEFANFDLKLDWKISKGANSGIFFYVREDMDRFNNPNKSGLEMQIDDDENNENGKIPEQKNGDLVGLVSSSSDRATKPVGQWNQAEIKSNRGKLDFFLNGEHILSTTLWNDKWEDLISNSKFKKMDDYGTFKKGRIALQDHGADVWFKNIMIRKL